MLNRRTALRLAVALPAAWLAASRPAAAQDFAKFTPFLVDLPGWTGNKPDGMAMQMPGNSMISATREYRRGSAKFGGQIIIGAAAQGMLAPIHSGMKLETADMHMSTATVDGFALMRTFQVKDQSGAILVALASNAVLTLNFNGVPEDEAFALARRFDWKAIQAAVPKESLGAPRLRAR